MLMNILTIGEKSSARRWSRGAIECHVESVKVKIMYIARLIALTPIALAYVTIELDLS